MDALNVLPPSIEPHASGHIIEQIAYVQKILDAGYAYVSEGSVYFDVKKYAEKFNYGILLQMSHVGDIAHVAHFIADVGQIAEKHIESDGRTCMSQMSVTIDGRAAHVHADAFGND